MRVLVAALLALAAITLSPVPAQVPPPPAGAPTPAAPMLATDRFLFVLRGDTLYQFDVRSLRLLHTFDFAQQAVAAGGPANEAEGQGQVEKPQPRPPQQQPQRPLVVAPAIEAALRWLAQHQDDDGRWDADGFMKHDKEGKPCDGAGNAVHDIGVTSLACMAMLDSGSSLREGQYKEPLQRAVRWLADQQQRNGLIGGAASHDFIYDHSLGALALCTAYARSDYNTIKAASQSSLDYLESHRNPYGVWRYQPRDNDNDTSVTSWALQALDAGRDARLQTNPQAFKLVGAWFESVTDATGKAGYSKIGEPSSRHPGDHGTRFPVGSGEAMTAAALYGRFLLGQDPDQQPIMRKSAELLLAKPPRWQKQSIDAYYWYLGTQAMRRMGGTYWQQWAPHLQAVVEAQRQDGNCVGSWDPIGVWDEDGGRVYATALNTMTLLAARPDRKPPQDEPPVDKPPVDKPPQDK